METTPQPDHRRAGRPPSGDSERGSTRTVDRALTLFDAVLDGGGPTGLSSLARAAGLSPSTASRLLETLAQHRLIERDLTGSYRPGIRLKQLAATALRDDQLYELSGPHLEELARATREAASLGTPLGPDEVLYLRQVAAPGQLVQAVGWVGRTIPRRETAMGKALDDDLEPEGYAVSSRIDNEVDAVAVPIRDHSGEIVATLSVTAPRYRTSLADLHEFGRLLREHGQQLSTTLGAG